MLSKYAPPSEPISLLLLLFLLLPPLNYTSGRLNFDIARCSSFYFFLTRLLISAIALLSEFLALSSFTFRVTSEITRYYAFVNVVVYTFKVAAIMPRRHESRNEMREKREKR